MLSVALAAVLTAVVGAASAPRRVAVLPEWVPVPPTAAVFIQFFGLCFAVGLLGRILHRNIEKLQELFAEWIGDPLRERWHRLSRRTQAVLFGIFCGLLAGGIVTGGVLYYGYSAAFVVVMVVCTWPAATYWLLGRRPSMPPTDTESRIVRTRYATLRHLETRTIGALSGFLLASAVGSGLWLLGVESAWAVVVGALVWVVSTVVVYNWYAATLETRSDLTIVDRSSRDDGMIELVVRNDSFERINLTGATITDTRIDRYHLTDPVQVPPANSLTLCLPDSFAVAPTDSERTLPLGYTLSRSQPTPVIYTRSGIAFELTCTETDDETVVELAPEYTTPSTAIGVGTQS